MWTCMALFSYIILSQHAFITVFNDSSQAPIAYAGDLGIFRLFTPGGGFFNMHADLAELEAGTLILYRTTESENGLKLGLIVKKSIKDGVPQVHTLESAKQFHQVVHHSIALEAVLNTSHRFTENVVSKSLGVMLRRYSDECQCAEDYADRPRYFVKPIAEVHAVLYSRFHCLGLPIFALHRFKVLLSGSGIAGGVTSLVTSLVLGQRVTLYDLDLASRGTGRRNLFLLGCALLCRCVCVCVCV